MPRSRDCYASPSSRGGMTRSPQSNCDTTSALMFSPSTLGRPHAERHAVDFAFTSARRDQRIHFTLLCVHPQRTLVTHGVDRRLLPPFGRLRMELREHVEHRECRRDQQLTERDELPCDELGHVSITTCALPRTRYTAAPITIPTATKQQQQHENSPINEPMYPPHIAQRTSLFVGRH